MLIKKRCFSMLEKNKRSHLVVIVLVGTISINLLLVLLLDHSNKLETNQEILKSTNKHVNMEMTTIKLNVLSSRGKALVIVDGLKTYSSNDSNLGRGIHVVVLNQMDGSIMAGRHFDTYLANQDELLIKFIDEISTGRIIILTIKDEGSYKIKKSTRNILQNIGSKYVQHLNWRDMWAFVFAKNGNIYGELFNKSSNIKAWGDPVHLKLIIPCVPPIDSHCLSQMPSAKDGLRRRQFCNKYEGYVSVCNCQNPESISNLSIGALANSQVNDVPVVVIASNRPQYLYRMVRSLLSARGVVPDMITVFIDGFYNESLAVANLFGIRGIQHTPIGKKNARISQHYKASLTAAFNIFPNANNAIILEEDLDISPDFFSFFSQTLHLLEEDSTLYCISAWNDLGYQHTASDPSLLYRVDTMPGLGWMLKKSLFKSELEPNWPSKEKMWDWDMWLRLPTIRKARECLVPDISRTFHFGASGLNMNSYFQDRYFNNHAFYKDLDVKKINVHSMTSTSYENNIHDLLSKSKALSTTMSPCSKKFSFPETEGYSANALYIRMKNVDDTSTWLQTAKCFRIWDLDARGSHAGMWRIMYRGKPLLVIGFPFSRYSHHKPDDILPLYLEGLNSTHSHQNI